MQWLTNIFNDGSSKVIDSVSKGLDNLFTSDQERLQLKNELERAMNTFKQDMESKSLEYEKEVTKRWETDSEHIITRLVRPLSYIAVLLLFGFIVLLDGNAGEFIVNKAYIPVIETLLATMTISYFGSRGIEKTVKHFKS